MTFEKERRLRSLLRYDQNTGVFRWAEITSNSAARKPTAGGFSNGYVLIAVDRVRYRAHRLAWFFVTGAWPLGEIDHINGDRSDNRFVNLRDVSGAMNRQNVRVPRAHNKGTGVLGVDRLPGGRFRARVRHNGVTHYAGVFDTTKLAHDAYVKAKRALHEGCTL